MERERERERHRERKIDRQTEIQRGKEERDADESFDLHLTSEVSFKIDRYIGRWRERERER